MSPGRGLCVLCLSRLISAALSLEARVPEDPVLARAIEQRDAALAKARALDEFINTYRELLCTRSDAEFLIAPPRPRTASGALLLR